jgi:hypothetical protein
LLALDLFGSATRLIVAATVLSFDEYSNRVRQYESPPEKPFVTSARRYIICMAGKHNYPNAYG